MDWGLALAVGAPALNVVVGLALVALVLVATPRRLPHLALVAFILAAVGNAIASTLWMILVDPWWRFNAGFYSILTIWCITAAYAVFIGVAIPSPLARPLRSTTARVLLLVGLAVLAIAAFANPALFANSRTPITGSWGPLGHQTATSVNGILLVWALVGSLDALRRSPRGSAARRRARAYALAFGIQDAGVLLVFVLRQIGSVSIAVGASLFIFVLLGWMLIARAMIRDHLFDADLRIKSGLARGALAAIFLAAFFVAAAVAEQYLQQYGVVIGGVAVGILLFALRPLEHAAQRIANVAMPRVQDTEEYRMVRKGEVYRAALESAIEDGDVTDKERGMLATLQDQLGISANEALRIEREARGLRNQPSAASSAEA